MSISREAGDHHFVDAERLAIVCRRCKGRLSPEAVASGRWVGARPRADRRGYHISRLVVPGQDIAELVGNHRSTDEDSVRVHYG